MTRRTRRAVDIFNLSFLDVVSCGFGAIILLLVIVKVSEPLVIEKLYDEIAPRYGDRNSGYTRIVKLGPRPGDSAPMVQLELV